ncbi:hypothetical protein FSARC_9681 [Fusarium sarcochroum]|uniref:Extracellular membrane protein CFEM domain-containing protein n=1 Tax=Fusarium sarcochroum TaxID=1208366 RepID=A0A8H4TQT3_9HYPO|nr:hypothetical protein FSARC_9681 [Fusarium sarcochroum]
MRVHRVSHLLALGLIPIAHLAEANPHTQNLNVLAEAPVCATTCLAQTQNATTDFQGSQVELCHNKKFYSRVHSCVTHDCNVTEISDFLNVTQITCGIPATDRRREINITCLVMGVLALGFFGMRVVSKIIGFVPYGHDDSLILVAFPVVVAFNVFCQIIRADENSHDVVPSKGLGLDIWAVSDENVTSFLIFLLSCEFAYAISLALIKLSILAFFLRIFPDNRFRKMVWWTTGFILITCVVYLTLFLIQRKPLSLFWDGWMDKEPRGVMLDANAMGISHGAINVALDIWMLILPTTQLYKVGLRLKKKLGVIAMLSVGLL